MSWDIVSLHQKIDQWAAEQRAAEEKAKEAAVAGEVASPSEPSSQPNATPEIVGEVIAKVLPEGKRLVRTKTSGDTVYYIDEVKKTRQRIVGSASVPGPDIVEALGFSMADVQDTDDSELLRYQMAAALYKLPDEA